MSEDEEGVIDPLEEIEAMLSGESRRPRKGGKTGWTGESRRPERQTPKDILEKYLERFDPKVGDSPERKKELEENKEKYFGWVNDALEDPERIMEDEDLEVRNRPTENYVNVRHEPSSFFSRREDRNTEGRLMVAKEELKMQLEKHLSYWDKAPQDFRERYGVTSKQPE